MSVSKMNDKRKEKLIQKISKMNYIELLLMLEKFEELKKEEDFFKQLEKKFEEGISKHYHSTLNN